MKRKRIFWLISALATIVVLGAASTISFDLSKIMPETQKKIDGKRMYADVVAQVSMGARIPGSKAHAACVEWISASLKKSGWQVELQEADYNTGRIRNLIARRGDKPARVILGAHYDTRPYADQDPLPARKALPVPGANDGASGVAVLLELARVLDLRDAETTRLVFFDAEDSGGINGWEWAAGSRLFVETLREKPEAAVILDMIGDADLKIYQERNSDATLTAEIWQAAADLGYQDVFLREQKHALIDDHIPFKNAGIPAVDVIDFDYPAWHTTGDTEARVSPDSLRIAGEVIRAWLVVHNENDQFTGGE